MQGSLVASLAAVGVGVFLGSVEGKGYSIPMVWEYNTAVQELKMKQIGKSGWGTYSVVD